MQESLQLSLLNDYLYCHRRAALKVIEGWRGTNSHTVLGDLAHEHADLSGYEVAKGVLLWRALPVWSERLGLSGKCDIVEVRLKEQAKGGMRDAECVSPAEIESIEPVEYKKGKRRQFDNDDAQLCAQALCLEEMFGSCIERGAVFHATSKRRREVVFTPELRELTESAIRDLHALTESDAIPAAIFKPACEACSLFEVCLPRITANPDAMATESEALFRI